MERFIVHEFDNGRDVVIGSFIVQNGQIHFDSKVDEMNCDIFPPGPIHPATARRLSNLLNNKSKSVYIVHG